MIGAICILLVFEVIGEGLRIAARLPVPGPVIGMLLLAAVLIIRQRKSAETAVESEPPSELDRVSGALISHMGLLFVPAGVGVMAQAQLLRTEWLPILGGLLGSTVLGLLVTALVMHWTLRSQKLSAEKTAEVR